MLGTSTRVSTPHESIRDIDGHHHRAAEGFAWAAFVVGMLYAAVSVYWGLGGTLLLDTLGGSLERKGRSGGAAIRLVVWAAAILKMIASVLPLAAVRRLSTPSRDRAVRVVGWVEAGVLTTYGLVLTSVGLLVQANLIHPAVGADRHALAWHAYFWDPWFLGWGVLVTLALARSRHRPMSQRRLRRQPVEF